MKKFLALFATIFATINLEAADAPDVTPAAPAQHPALFLVGDSIMKTGTPPGDRGPWGMGYELGPLFDPAKIHVYNEGAGGRSTRGYMEEGLWTKTLARVQPGDFILVMFGHNDTANSANYPDRATINASGDETLQLGVGAQRKVIHTYGWYLRQYAAEAKAKGATLIICSPVPRNQWADGKIKRGFDGYAAWATESAKLAGVPFIDLNTLACDRYDALGQEKTRAYFNDPQHTTKLGARVNAECVVEGIKRLANSPLAQALVPTATPR